MLQVRHLLQLKGSTVHHIEPDEPVLAAIQSMAERGIGALLVMQSSVLVGMVSERDYARKVILKGRSSRETRVREIMTGEVVTVSPADSVEACMHLCTDHHVRHLPVMEDGAIVGLVSIGDLVKAVIDQQSEQIQHLQNYISG